MVRKRAFTDSLRRKIRDTQRLHMWNQAAIYRRRRRTFAVSVVLVLLLILIIATTGGGGIPSKRATTGQATLPTSPAPLEYTPSAALLAPILASAAARIPGNPALTLLGGLDANNSASAGVAFVDSTTIKLVGTLPASLFAAAAVTIGEDEYLFGGAEGTASAPVPQPYIYSYAVKGSGAITQDGELHSPNYGLSAAVIGQTVYLVGGDDGTHTLADIYAWSPGHGAPTLAAQLPVGLRYAAVSAVGERLVIAGGLTASGPASKAIYVFDSATHKIKALRTKLPRAIYAAAGETLGKLAYVIGGATVGGTATNATALPVGTIYSVDPATGKVANAGTLQYPLAEAAATVIGDTIYLAGGLSGSAAVSYVGKLTVKQALTTSKSKTH